MAIRRGKLRRDFRAHGEVMGEGQERKWHLISADRIAFLKGDPDLRQGDWMKITSTCETVECLRRVEPGVWLVRRAVGACREQYAHAGDEFLHLPASDRPA